MHNGQFGGPIGPFPDPTTGQPVSCTVSGNFVFVCGGDPNAVIGNLQAQILRAVQTVVAQKLASNQVALVTLPQSLPYFAQEIIAQSGAQQMGVQIQQLNMSATVQAPPAPAPAPMQMPPTPQQSAANALGNAVADHLDPRNYNYGVKANIGGINIKASTDGGINTEGIKNQVVGKAKSAIIWYAAGCLIVGVVLLGLAGLGGYIYWSTVRTMPVKTSK